MMEAMQVAGRPRKAAGNVAVPPTSRLWVRENLRA
jgi:hypothetical protein